MKKIIVFLFVFFLFTPMCFAKEKESKKVSWFYITTLDPRNPNQFPGVIIEKNGKIRYFAIVHFFPKVPGGMRYNATIGKNIFSVKKLKYLGNEVVEIFLSKTTAEIPPVIKGFSAEHVSGIQGHSVGVRKLSHLVVAEMPEKKMSSIVCFSSFEVDSKKKKKIYGIICDGRSSPTYIGVPFWERSGDDVYLLSFSATGAPYDYEGGNGEPLKSFPTFFLNKIPE